MLINIWKVGKGGQNLIVNFIITKTIKTLKVILLNYLF